MWLKWLLLELKIAIDGPINMLCDNQDAISMAKKPIHQDRTKHVETDRHFIKEKIEGGTINISYIPTTLQIVDILTKALPKTKFEDIRSNLGLTFTTHLEGKCKKCVIIQFCIFKCTVISLGDSFFLLYLTVYMA